MMPVGCWVKLVLLAVAVGAGELLRRHAAKVAKVAPSPGQPPKPMSDEAALKFVGITLTWVGLLAIVIVLVGCLR